MSAQLLPIIAERRHISSLELMGLKSSIADKLPCPRCFDGFTNGTIVCARVANRESDHFLVKFHFGQSLLISYLVLLSAFAMALAPLLNRGEERVSQVAFLLCFVVGLTYVGALFSTGNNLGTGAGMLKLALSVCPFGAAHLGGEIILSFEGNQQGVNWSNVHSRPGVSLAWLNSSSQCGVLQLCGACWHATWIE